MRKRVENRVAISPCGNGIGKEGQPAFPLKGIGALCALSEKTEITRQSPPLGKGIRRVTSASRERCLRTPERKRRTRKSCGVAVAEGAAPSEGAACAAPSEAAACAAAPEYRNAAFSSHEDKDRAGPKRELLHCSVRFRAEQHRPPPSESFTTASSPILMAAAIVSPTTRFA